MINLTFSKALDLAPHYKAIGQTTVYLDDKADDLPWRDVKIVESGGVYRLSGPISAYMSIHRDGVTFKWSVDFESRGENGAGTTAYDRDTLRAVMLKLAPEGRKAFCDMLRTHCLPAVAKHTREIREALNRQSDSEDCLRGLIAFAEEQAA